jgi:hypothetical protein
MTTVTVELPFELTREHMLLLRAAERGIYKFNVLKPLKFPEDIWPILRGGMIREDGGAFFHLQPLGRAILEQCPALWEPAELEAKLREMAG